MANRLLTLTGLIGLALATGCGPEAPEAEIDSSQSALGDAQAGTTELTSCKSGYGLYTIGWSSTDMSTTRGHCGGGPTLKYGRHFCLEGVGYHSYSACGSAWYYGYTDGPTYGWVKSGSLR